MSFMVVENNRFNSRQGTCQLSAGFAKSFGQSRLLLENGKNGGNASAGK
jgi:hypothetical protein